jgi:small subunit ribosomal protein S17
MKIKEIRDLSIEEITSRKRKLQEESFHLRVKHTQQSGNLEKPSELRIIRREIARLNTVLSQKANAAATTK